MRVPEGLKGHGQQFPWGFAENTQTDTPQTFSRPTRGMYREYMRAHRMRLK